MKLPMPSQKLPIPSQQTKKKFGISLLLLAIGLAFSNAGTVDPTAATVQAARLNGILTGGAIPYTDPVFSQMVSLLQAGNATMAAAAAVDSKYFPYYLPRRMAKQMMNAQMNESSIPDNDSVAFIVSNLLGLAGTQPSIGVLWSQNATYCVDLGSPTVKPELFLASSAINNGACGANETHLFFAGNPLLLDWTAILQKVPLQQVSAFQDQTKATPSTTNFITIAPQDVGGYMTLADAEFPSNFYNLGNFSYFAFHNGTNLRAIEYLYEISLGVTLASMENTVGVTADMTPKFIPSSNPNFLVGNNQPSCISCHGGGAPNRLHGYATVADKFDWAGFGMQYFPKVFNTVNPGNPGSGDPASSLGKSFGSNFSQPIRELVGVCDQVANPDIPCNPASPGVSPTQAWDLSYWKKVGLLDRWGWNGSMTGSGLNSLGTAVGQSNQVFQFMTQRVISEICPTGNFNQTQINNIAAAAMTREAAAQNSATHLPADQGPFGYIVVTVATDPSCI